MIHSELVYEGSNYLRQRLVLSTLSGKTIKIKKIRDKDEYPGLNEYEANLIGKLSRQDLENQFFNILKDLNVLKLHGRKQEEKIKKYVSIFHW